MPAPLIYSAISSPVCWVFSVFGAALTASDRQHGCIEGTPHAISRPVVEVIITTFNRLKDKWHGAHYLSPSEHAHASSITDTNAATNFRLSRSYLRCVLANYSGIPPNAVELSYLPDGKPVIYNGPVFNISHSQSLLVIAVATPGDITHIGVDVEPWVEDTACLSLAERIFSDEELQELQSFKPGRDQNIAFTRGWTRKEAIVKALGCGLRKPLNKFDVSLSAVNRNKPYQSMLLGDIPDIPPMQECKLFDLGARCNSELSLAVIACADQYDIKVCMSDDAYIESALPDLA